MSDDASNKEDKPDSGKRDFLLYATSAVGVAGTGIAAWPFVHSMNPAKDVLALAVTEVDLSPIEEGQSITVMWRKKPVFIRRRTPDEIALATEGDQALLRDPVMDADRFSNPEWLVVIGICPHLGCVPQGQRPGESRGDFGGWFCTCHGSHYDTSGRVRKGPSPGNLKVPDYTFLKNNVIRIG